MTYPPTTPGYPAPQPPAGYGHMTGQPAGPMAAAPSPARMPTYLAAAVLGLGLAAYLSSFAPQMQISAAIGPFGGAQLTASGLSFWTMATLAAALLAGVGVLPKVASYTPVVAVLAILAVLLCIAQVVNSPAQISIGWGLWLGLMLTVLQAATALFALVLESGVIRMPAPRPRYAQYGPPPFYYPGPQGGQQPGYPTPYGGYPPGQAPGGHLEDNTDTPPTGFPLVQPPAEPGSGSGPASAPDSTTPTP